MSSILARQNSLLWLTSVYLLGGGHNPSMPKQGCRNVVSNEVIESSYSALYIGSLQLVLRCLA